MHVIQPRPRQFWSENRWILLGLAWLAGLALGCFGFYIFALENGEDWTAGDILYRTLQLVTIESGAVTGRVNGMLEAARFLLPLLTVFTLLQALMLLFLEQGQKLRLRRVRDHVVICGMGRKGSRLARELLGLGRQVVIVEKAPRKEDIALFRQLGAIILDADATNKDVLANARVLHARYLVCLLGDDGDNLRTAYQAFRLTRTRRSGKLTCVVHLASIDLLNLIRSSELSTEQGVSYELETFNVYERTARMLLQDSPGWREDSPPETIPDSLLVVGLGRLGEHLVTQAGHQWHLLHRKGRLHITVVDLDAQEKVSSLSRKNPRLGRVCKIHPVQADLCAVGPLQNLLPHQGQQALNQVFICLADPILSLQVSLNLLQIPAFDSGEIRMRLSKEAGLNDLLEEPLPGLGESHRVRTFDFLDHSCSASLIIGGLRETLARDVICQSQ